jgi:hypothetical protein
MLTIEINASPSQPSGLAQDTNFQRESHVGQSWKDRTHAPVRARCSDVACRANHYNPTFNDSARCSRMNKYGIQDGTVSTPRLAHPSCSDVLMRRQFEAVKALYIETPNVDTNLIIKGVRLFMRVRIHSSSNLHRVKHIVLEAINKCRI